AYYRRVRGQLLATLAEGHEPVLARTYPEPVDTCELCRWWMRCNSRRRADDHLSFIAGIGRSHRTELVAQQVPTLAAAAALPDPLPFAPTRGSRETYERLRDQARVQHQQRTAGQPVHELLPVVPSQGLGRLPEPSAGDLFLDLEGAAYAREGGREYLFGLWMQGEYRAWWAHDDAEEQRAFEQVMDLIATQWAAHPGMHVYHYAPYEPTAFKRLMGRYASRAEDLDRLLRGERFVDLLAVVRQSVRAGVESYSIKQLEQYYGFVREVPLTNARVHLTTFELALESGAAQAVPAETREAVAGYNKDDCRSTEALRDWLERLRAEVVAAGTDVPRPEEKAAEPPKKVGELEDLQLAARARLLEGLAPEAGNPGHANHPRWLLAYLLDWHRREDKAQYWERYRLNDLPDEDLFDEKNAIAGLEFVGTVGTVSGRKKGSVRSIDRYTYPPQDTEIRAKGELLVSGGPTRIGDIEAHDREASVLDIKKTEASAGVHPAAVFQSTVINTDVLQKSLLRMAERVEGESCGMDLLHRRPPRLTQGTLAALDGESLVDQARRLAVHLDHTTLAVQGPPGSGKTYLGAQMIRALVAAGRRVGVVAPSHKVIENLLEAVDAQARETGETVRLGRKVGSDDDAVDAGQGGIREYDDNDAARAAIEDREVEVCGGTAWLWARPEFAGAVDVLFVDEAGQLSLANALAVSPAASSLVLLGDPQQLQQPQKGNHPDGVDVSSLQHVLGPGGQTMPADKGLFLPVTWRMAPAVCTFTSEQFYEGKLTPRAGLERQQLTGTDGLDGAGLRWIEVDHAANRNWSAEEIDAVEALMSRLLVPGAAWTTSEGEAKPLTAADILVVAPYNAHVNRLADRLAPRGIAVGTVDKFQGQEAPVVVFAMASSSPEDAPRGMEFLYSRHRLNVATSRARCAVFVVASPALLEPECRTPRQMALANALCRFVECACT
ncbi:MAG: TM0106 family RecB-like putative nuclease, partial [Acidobacteria bacterium]|nr:TM0106 family RecB-like putative nuclease [Acidobacteriota bacterium]